MSTRLNWKKILVTSVLVLFLIWFSVGLLYKINVFNADIGRHIVNGNGIIYGTSEERSAILHTNYFSYTHPDFPFINHHWAGSVILAGVYNFSGYVGLSIFRVVLLLVSFLLVFRIAQKETNTIIAISASAVVLPLMTYRNEIRPETFTVLFCSILLFLFWKWLRSTLNNWYLLLVPLIMLLWVNTHIGFIFGFAIIGIAIVNEFFSDHKEKKKRLLLLGIVLLCSMLIAIANPNGIEGAMYPFKIFSNYGYSVYENFSMNYIERMGLVDRNFSYFKIVLVSSWIVFISYLFRKKTIKPILSLSALVALMFTFMSLGAVRNLSLVGYFLIPMLAISIRSLFSEKEKNRNYVEFSLCVFVIISAIVGIFVTTRNVNFGPNIIEHSEDAVTFYNKLSLKGEVFNNYDIGGYLIRYLQNRKVFIDNRPEAYPADFIQKEYIPMQQSVPKWQENQKKYNLTSVFWYLHDRTGWSKDFIAMILADKQWAIVYWDNSAMVALKRGVGNDDYIKKHELQIKKH